MVKIVNNYKLLIKDRLIQGGFSTWINVTTANGYMGWGLDRRLTIWKAGLSIQISCHRPNISNYTKYYDNAWLFPAIWSDTMWKFHFSLLMTLFAFGFVSFSDIPSLGNRFPKTPIRGIRLWKYQRSHFSKIHFAISQKSLFSISPDDCSNEDFI